jgi:hypothetical protein
MVKNACSDFAAAIKLGKALFKTKIVLKQAYNYKMHKDLISLWAFYTITLINDVMIYYISAL